MGFRHHILILSLLLLLCSCGKDAETDALDLWNDLLIEDELVHFKKVRFADESVITGQADPSGRMALRLTLPDGTPVTRRYMLACQEGERSQFKADRGQALLTLDGLPGNNGDYRAVDGQITIERHDFKTIIDMDSMLFVNLAASPTDTLHVRSGYLNFDLTIFGGQ